MGSNKFKINLSIRLLLIVLNALLFAFYIIDYQYFFIIINLLVLIVLQAISLFKYIYTQFNLIEKSLDQIEFNDAMLVIKNDYNNDTFNIGQKIKNINTHLSTIISENEQRNIFIEGIINHIDIAIICINNNQFELINNAAKKLFNTISPGLNERYFDKNEFFRDLRDIKESEKIIYNLGPQYENMKLLVSSFKFKSKESESKIIAIQNVRSQLESYENESWLKLTRYLTHEIMNSVTPIVSTTKGISKLYLNKTFTINEYNKSEVELINDTLEGVEIVQERAEGLLRFISNYRDLFEIKKIKKSEFGLEDFIKDIVHLFKNSENSNSVALSYKIIPASLKIKADKTLLEQVVINLLKNSIQATLNQTNPFIKIYGFINTDQNLQIDVIDNGSGIPEDIFDKIFIPFYSTKKEGSGIGLSFARYIMQLHGGQLLVKTSVGKTIFSLIF